MGNWKEWGEREERNNGMAQSGKKTWKCRMADNYIQLFPNQRLTDWVMVECVKVYIHSHAWISSHYCLSSVPVARIWMRRKVWVILKNRAGGTLKIEIKSQGKRETNQMIRLYSQGQEMPLKSFWSSGISFLSWRLCRYQESIIDSSRRVFITFHFRRLRDYELFETGRSKRTKSYLTWCFHHWYHSLDFVFWIRVPCGLCVSTFWFL